MFSIVRFRGKSQEAFKGCAENFYFVIFFQAASARNSCSDSQLKPTCLQSSYSHRELNFSTDFPHFLFLSIRPFTNLILYSILVMPSKPVIALVEGAWHSPVHYSKLTDLLKAAGYETVTRRNPSCGAVKASEADVAADTAAARNDLLLPYIDAGRDVVLVAHSYGGSPAAAAAAGLSKAAMSKASKRGGIIGLIYIAAFIAQEGDSLISKLPGQQLEPWYILEVSFGPRSPYIRHPQRGEFLLIAIGGYRSIVCQGSQDDILR